jgi:hypothetical protein
MEKIGNMQITDNKENKFFCFPIISMACTGSGYTETLVSRLTSVFLLLGSKKNKIELKSGIIHKKTGLLIDAKTTIQHNVFFQKHIILKEIVC